MRLCMSCNREDRPQLDIGEQCSCSSGSREPSHHAAECRAVVHEVVMYPVRMEPRDLKYDANGTALLPRSYLTWKLLQNGERWYRWKHLCRACIEQMAQSEAFKRDYLKACKKARGQSDQTYAQMLAEQSML